MTSCSPSPSIIAFMDMATTLSELQQAHAHMLKTGLVRSTFAASRIIAFAATAPSSSPQSLAYAHSVFTHIDTPNSYTWSTIIRAHANSPTPENALLLFHQMLYSPVLPDKYTFPFVTKACSLLHAIEEGQQIHARVLKAGLCTDVYIGNTLIHMYASLGYTEQAFCLFDRMIQKDVISWNAIISGCMEQGLMEDARRLFDEMPERNVESWNFMITWCIDCGLVDDARSLFDRMPCKDVVSWNAMITGYMRASRFTEALRLAQDMQLAKVKPDNFTLVNVLSACARVGALSQGEWVHAYINKNGIEISGFIATALVDMYCKCGNLEKALQVFSNTKKKDITTWNSMIGGFSTHGNGEYALRFFSEMSADGFAPNEITFISVLSACSHAGLLNEGRRVFNLMTQVHEIEPAVEHYGCMVDLLGRARLFEEAEDLVNSSLCKDKPVVWESLLGACRSHGNVELAERVARRLVELDPNDSACYILLSNIYASMRRWDDVREVRGRMRTQKVKKEPGCSMIDVDGTVHEFRAGDRLHPQADEIYRKVDEMADRLKSVEYVPDTSQVLFEIGEEEKEIALLRHSEKLAIAFGLLNTGEGATIRIIKNLKVCRDCHTATKLISKVYGREIVVRDKNRFHHFKDGFCSCKDYW
ncbi:hypothetical protein MRB53_036106 [Persea americana]|uniref:Uncharacterized protein n=1 Tax=Persea americana TaxID=3435 RepID=A0ACC2K6I6_PERAE|nr:hypothetical protein MRB53_036106 [Persea americana]